MRVGLSACALLLSAGCAMQRAPIGPPRVDARSPEAPRAAASARPAEPPAEPECVSLPVAGSSLTRSRAKVAVDASIAEVRAILFDFEHYPEFLPDYRSAKIVGTTPNGGRDVAMEVDELGGVIKLRLHVEVSGPMTANGVEAYDGRLIRGNVKVFESRWELESLPDGRTRLALESLVDPDLPIPSSFINKGSLAGVRDAILAIKARAERRHARGAPR